jgi:Tol biopolymer transport system component
VRLAAERWTLGSTTRNTAMRMRRMSLILGVLLSIAEVTEAQRPAFQPIEWVLQEASGDAFWGYIAPDDETITFSRSSDGRTWDLLRTNRHGREPRPFLITPPAVSLTRGVWSRTHHQLAFTAGTKGDSTAAIYVADSAGQEVRRIPAQGVSNHVMYPSWMPDGRSVVVVDYGAPGGSTLFLIDIATGTSKALTNPADFLVGMPSVSPDGELIAFAGQPNRESAYDQSRNRIWLLPMSGPPREVSGGQGRQPDWSPDGQWLAFTSNRGDSTGRNAVFIVDRDGQNLMQLTDHAPNASHPVWSPDGSWLLFSAQTAQGKFGLARVKFPEGLK